MPGPRSLEFGSIAEKTSGAYGGTSVGAYSVMQADEYALEPEATSVNQEKFVGQWDVTNQDIEQLDLRGAMTWQIWPENASLACQIAGIVGAVAGRNADGTMREYVARWYDRAKGEYLQHTGLMCDVCRIQIRPNESLRFSYDLIGQAETTIAAFTQDAIITRTAYKMSHAYSTGAAPAGIRFVTGSEDPSTTGVLEPNFIEGTIEIRNNLAPSEPRNGSMQILWIDTGMRIITFTCRVRTNSDMAMHYRDAVRLRKTDCAWNIVFNYPGTGSPFDTFAIELGRMSITKAARTGGVPESQVLDLSFEVAKPAAQEAIVATLT